LSFNINFHETSVGFYFKRAFGEVYKVSATSFLKVYAKSNSILLLSCDFIAHMGTHCWTRFPQVSHMPLLGFY